MQRQGERHRRALRHGTQFVPDDGRVRLAAHVRGVVDGRGVSAEPVADVREKQRGKRGVGAVQIRGLVSVTGRLRRHDRPLGKALQQKFLRRDAHDVCMLDLVPEVRQVHVRPAALAEAFLQRVKRRMPPLLLPQVQQQLNVDARVGRVGAGAAHEFTGLGVAARRRFADWRDDRMDRVRRGCRPVGDWHLDGGASVVLWIF